MDNLKLTISWNEVLLKSQNGEECQSFCDLKLNCIDGYIFIHKVLVPLFNSSGGFSETASRPVDCLINPESSAIKLPNLTLSQVSKLVLLMYTGETIISTSEQKKLKPLFNAFQISHLKRVSFPRNIPNTRRGSVLGISQNNNSPEAKRKALAQRKIRGVKYLDNEMTETENVYIYGDGSIMAVPVKQSETGQNNGETSVLCYDENGDVGEQRTTGFCCSPCSLIFCESSDFLDHSIKCPNKHDAPNTPRVIKVENDYIKVESATDDTDPVEQPSNSVPLGSMVVCLICVTSCADISDLIVHSNMKHNISSELDYDIGTWQCRRCKLGGASRELSVFLQHVYHCRRESRKRSISSTNESLDMMDSVGQKIKRQRTLDRIKDQKLDNIKVHQPHADKQVDNVETLIDDVRARGDKLQGGDNRSSRKEAYNLGTAEDNNSTKGTSTVSAHLEKTTSDVNEVIEDRDTHDVKLNACKVLNKRVSPSNNEGTTENSSLAVNSTNSEPCGKKDTFQVSKVVITSVCGQPNTVVPPEDTSEALIRSPKSLLVVRVGNQKTHFVQVNDDCSKENSFQSVLYAETSVARAPDSTKSEMTPQSRLQFLDKHSTHPNPMVIFKGVNLNMSGVKTGIKKLSKVSKESTGRWLKKNYATTSSWTCRRCTIFFNSQKIYMQHICKGAISLSIKNTG